MNRAEVIRNHRGSVILAVALLTIIIVRLIFPERPLDYVGFRALIDAGFALALLGLVLLLAMGIGLKVLGWLNIARLSGLNKYLFSLAIGLGVLAYGVMTLGMAGYLKPITVLIFLSISILLTWRKIVDIGVHIPAWLSGQFRAYSNLELPAKAFIILIGFIFGLSAIQALAPPWGYDSLMYHLQAPRLFLDSGSIVLLPDIWQANGPMTIEMLYAIGLALDSDVFAKLMHLTFTGLVMIGCFSLGRHLLGRTGGWLSAAILLGIPIFPIWGSLAYTDLALVFYELLAVFAMVLWSEKNQDKMLVLSGLMMGWALGSKYTAFGLAGVLGMWVLVRWQKGGGMKVMHRGIIYGFPILLIAAPWYLKNLVLSGNPMYPFVFGGPYWDEESLSALMIYLIDGFGVGRTFWDYVLLPFNIYSQAGNFGTTFGTIDYPSFLFPLILLYPWARRYANIDAIAGITLAFFAFWASGTQQTRFLFPVFPLLSIIVALVLLWMSKLVTSQSIRRILGIGLVGSFVMLTLVYQIAHLIKVSPQLVVIGTESKQTFLMREVFDYRAIQFAERTLNDKARLLMIWDGQGYYCDRTCIPDPEPGQLLQMAKASPSPLVLARDLNDNGVSHILIDVGGLGFLYYHNPDGRQQRAADYFFKQFLPICGEKVFEDDTVFVYEISCLE